LGSVNEGSGAEARRSGGRSGKWLELKDDQACKA